MLQDTAHVLTLLPLLESASSSPSYVRVPAQILREVINASIAMLRLMNTEGLIECVLGFLINVHAEVLHT